MTITGYQFDKAQVSAAKDAALYNALANREDFILKGVGQELSVRVSNENRTITVGTGMALIQGHLVEVIAPETLSIPDFFVGHLVIELDFSKQNTSSGSFDSGNYAVNIRQVALRIVNSQTKSNLSNGGVRYQFSLGELSTSGETIAFQANVTFSPIERFSTLVVSELTKTVSTLTAALNAEKEKIAQTQLEVRKKQIQVPFGSTGIVFSVTRIGSLVYLEVHSIIGKYIYNSSESGQYGTLPVGFRPRNLAVAEIFRDREQNGDYQSSYACFLCDSNGRISLSSSLGGTNTNKYTISCRSTWVTDEPLPSY